MPSTRSSSRKKQTRLSFTPLSSSSPAAAEYPSQIQERAAAVRYYDLSSPTKKRRVAHSLGDGVSRSLSKPHDFTSPSRRTGIAVMLQSTSKMPGENPKLPHEGLLTPGPSSQIQHGQGNDDPGTEPLSSSSDSSFQTINSRRIMVRQISGKRRTTSEANLTTPMTHSTQAKPRNERGSSTTPQSVEKCHTLNDVVKDVSLLPAGATADDQTSTYSVNVDSENDSDLPPLISGKRNESKAPIIVSSDDESDDGAVRLATPRRSDRKMRYKDKSSPTSHQSRAAISPRVNHRSFLLGGSTGYAPVLSSRKRKTVVSTKLKRIENSPRRMRSSNKAKLVTATETRDRSTRRTKHSTPDQVHTDLSSDHETDSSAIEPQTPERNLRRVAAAQIEEPNSEDESDVILTSPRNTLEKTNTTSMNGTSVESDEDLVISHPKRKRISRPAERSSPRKFDGLKSQAQDDIDEDLEALQETELRQSRTRAKAASSKKTAAQKQLELLKQRRAGQKITQSSSESEEVSAPVHGLYDSDSPAAEVEISDEEGEDSGTEAIRQALHAESDAYDEDFVDDDGVDPLGVPLGLEEIPIEFTRFAHKKAIEHFKDAVEWMVHNKLNPAFARDDGVYQTAFYKLDDLVKGYASSKFLSSAWTGDFAKAIKARPELFEVVVPTMFDHKCDACNRSGHPAKFRITFGGKAYHRDSLEDVSDEEDEDEDDENSDAESHDSRGNPIPGIEREFFIGRFCKANATHAHALLHWRYNLNQWVLDWLKNESHTSAEKIVERENWSIKKRGDYANKVVDGMEETGEIKALYRDFKNNLEAARDAKPHRFRDH